MDRFVFVSWLGLLLFSCTYFIVRHWFPGITFIWWLESNRKLTSSNYKILPKKNVHYKKILKKYTQTKIVLFFWHKYKPKLWKLKNIHTHSKYVMIAFYSSSFFFERLLEAYTFFNPIVDFMLVISVLFFLLTFIWQL
jgi:hypothetical protein